MGDVRIIGRSLKISGWFIFDITSKLENIYWDLYTFFLHYLFI